jgi:ABC-type transport system substrate-binding protein
MLWTTVSYSYFLQNAFGVALAALLLLAGEKAMAKIEVNEIHAYMSYGLPIDPARIVTLVDYDFSYALASTLVNWSDAKEPTAALAESWSYSGERQITFELKPNLKWSDGSALTANDVVRSLVRAKAKYPEELKSLYNSVETITA